MAPPSAEIAHAFRAPFLPTPLAELAAVEGYLAHVWSAVRASMETRGFLGSALYMSDMALDAVEEVYEPVMSRADVLAAGVGEAELTRLIEVLDVFHYVQPQVLLVCAALAEAMDRPRVGGHGRVEHRDQAEREQRHLATDVAFALPGEGLLPEIAEALGVEEPPDLYRAVAAWPGYLAVGWEELQHLAAYPQFRRRGRGLYYYARSGSRFLAEPLEANPSALRAAGVADEAIEEARAVLDRSLPMLAMMMMHAEAMRVGLGIREREVMQG